MDIELLSITFAANETKRFERAGRRIDVLDAPYSIAEIALYDTGGAASGFLRNCEIGVYAKVPYQSFNITNGPVAQTVRLLVTDGDGGSNKQPGVVRVVDQGVEKTAALSQFLNSTRVAAQAGAAGLSVLLAGSRKVAIKRVQIAAATTQAVFFGYGTGAPGTVLGSTAANNKRVGGALSSAIAYAATAASGVPTALELPGYTFGGRVYVQDFVTVELALTTPILLQPGQCFLVNGAAINREVCGNFDFEEFD